MLKLFSLSIFATLALSGHARVFEIDNWNDDGLIVDGENAVNGQFPWSGHMQPGFCSCTLIALNRVLTAAHCVRDLGGGTVFFGDVTRNMGVQRTFRPEDTFLHPRDPEGQGFDIAVIRLQTAYQPSGLIMPVGIASDPNNFFENMTGRLTGFGMMNDSSWVQLQWVSMRVTSRAECTSVMGYRESVLCVQWPTSTGCTVDSAAGMVIEVNGVWRLVAVHGIRILGGCPPGRAAGLVRVSDHFSWITSI